MKIILLILAGVALLNTDVLLSGCGQILAPTGGPRDSLPPKLMSAVPPNQSVNFRGNRITLNFDEYVTLDQLRENLLVSPSPKNDPYIDSKLRSIIIKLRDTLEANTTYTINLGNSIHDLNEGNVLRNFSYTFSTGTTIDSLDFSGKVLIAETGVIDSTLLVMLYSKTEDSAVMLFKPKYITRLSRDGSFTFHNLSAASYRVYALKDVDGSRTYNKPTELFAFGDSPVVVNSNTDQVTLYAYAEEKEKGSTTRGTPDSKLRYSTKIGVENQDILTGIDIEFNRPLKSYDKNQLTLLDSAGKPLPRVTLKMDTSNKKLTLSNDWVPGRAYKLVVGKDLGIDTGGLTLQKNDTLSFNTKKLSEYGSLKVKIKNVKADDHPVLQLFSNNILVSSHAITGNEWFAPSVLAGEYEIRILFDKNKNGTWDPGNFVSKRQPEKVFSVPKRESVRANWDNEIEIVL